MNLKMKMSAKLANIRVNFSDGKKRKMRDSSLQHSQPAVDTSKQFDSLQKVDAVVKLLCCCRRCLVLLLVLLRCHHPSTNALMKFTLSTLPIDCRQFGALNDCSPASGSENVCGGGCIAVEKNDNSMTVAA